MRIPGEEKDRYYCTNCGFPCKAGETELGDYGANGWDFTSGYTIADDGITAATNLITNGEFSSNTNNWTGLYCTLAAATGGQSGKCLKITRTSATEQYAYQELSGLTFGYIYRVRAYVKSGTSGDEAYAIRAYTNDRSRIIRQVTGTTSSTWTLADPLYWRATEADNVIALVKNSDTAGTMLFDSVDGYGYEFKVKEALTGCPFCGTKNWK